MPDGDHQAAESGNGALLQDPRGGWLTVPGRLRPLVQEIKAAAARGDDGGALRSLRRLSAETASRQDLRWLWAVTQQQLGDLLYRMRSAGTERNLDEVIAAYSAALTVYTPAACAVEWATVQNNLGNAWRERRGKDAEESSERAIAAYRAALTVRTRAAHPYAWARTQNNLANAYAERVRGDGPENRRLAIGAYRAALEVHDPARYPRDYVMDQTNLGLTYQEHAAAEAGKAAEAANAGNSADAGQAGNAGAIRSTGAIGSLDRAIACFLSALLIRLDPRRERRLVLSLADAVRTRVTLTPARLCGDVVACLAPAVEVLAAARLRHGIPDPLAGLALAPGPGGTGRAGTGRGGTGQSGIGRDGDDAAAGGRSWLPDPGLFAGYLAARYRLMPLTGLIELVGSPRARAEPALRVDLLHAALARPDVVLPSFRADLSDELAVALLELHSGDTGSHQEEAIAALQGALEAYPRQEHPFQWGKIQSHLAAAFGNRILGDRAENLERAIQHGAAAVETRSPQSPEWPMMMTNLGQYYRDRRLGDPARNLTDAVAAFQAALGAWSRDSHPYEWARAQNSLGLAYLRMGPQEAQATEAAIATFGAALEVLRREDYPQEWAGVEFNLASAFHDRQLGNRSDNLERAISGFRACLAERTRERFPWEWARTQHNLGQAYGRRVLGDTGENLHQAAAHFRAALEVHTLPDRPADHRATSGALGEVEGRRRRWLAAHEAFASASAAGDLLLARVTTGVRGFDLTVREGHESGELDAFALVRLGRLTEAAEAVERGRTRWTTEALARQPAPDGDSSAAPKRDPADARGQWLTAAQLAARLDRCVVYLLSTQWGGVALAVLNSGTAPPGMAAAVVSCELPELTDAAVNDLIQQSLDDGTSRLVGGYGAAQEGLGLNWISGQWPGDTFADKAGSLHAACLAAGVSGTLDAAAQATLQLRQPGLPAIVHGALEQLDAVSRSRLSATLAHAFLAAELHRCLPKLADLVMRPVTDWLLGLQVHSVILVPCGPLPVFPLPAVPLDEVVPVPGNGSGGHGAAAGSTVADRILVTVAPSASSVLARVTSEPRSGLYALGNARPTQQELPWAEAEALTAAALAGDAERARVHEGATRAWLAEALRAGEVVDASCHGQFDGRDFRQSRLLLANGETLTLGDVLTGQVNLDGLRLLVLSACQTAVMDIRGAHGEVRSLAAGMLRAGARGVMAPLWAVDDHATYLLMTRFFQKWLPVMSEQSPALALAQAQAWLRTVTHQQLATWEAGARSGDRGQERDEADYPAPARLAGTRGRGDRYTMTEAEQLVTGLARRRASGAASEAPYADPIFWAAFQVCGR